MLTYLNITRQTLTCTRVQDYVCLGCVGVYLWALPDLAIPEDLRMRFRQRRVVCHLCPPGAPHTTGATGSDTMLRAAPPPSPRTGARHTHTTQARGSGVPAVSLPPACAWRVRRVRLTPLPLHVHVLIPHAVRTFPTVSCRQRVPSHLTALITTARCEPSPSHRATLFAPLGLSSFGRP